MNYASTANIEEVKKFYNLGHKTFETDFKCRTGVRTKIAKQMLNIIMPSLADDEGKEDWKPLFIAAMKMLTAILKKVIKTWQ